MTHPVPEAFRRPFPKPFAALVFVVFWAVAIVAWSLAHLIPDFPTLQFIVDIGIILACIGLAAPSLETFAAFRTALILGLVGIAFFAFGSYVHIPVIVYALRILGPFLALLTPVFKLANGVRIFAR